MSEIEASVPANTARAYVRQVERFEVWCAEQGRTAYPCTGEALAAFVSHLITLALGPASIDQAIAAIRVQHRDQGYEDQPDTRAALAVLRAHRRARAEHGDRTRMAPPIEAEVLRAMIEATPVADADGKQLLAGLRDRVLLVLGVALLGRRSELAALRLIDVAEAGDGLLVTIRSSSTDQADELVAIPRGPHPQTDPVLVVRAWLAALAEHGVTLTDPNARLLRAVNRWGHLGSAISEDGINKAVRAAAERAGLPDAATYTAQSLRAGGAATAPGRR